MNFPERYRAKHPLNFPHQIGDTFGWFMIPSPTGTQVFAVMADGQDPDWQHVSVSLRNRPPTWDEMCYIKNLFWDENETVVQYHPPKSDYVNIAKNCLHLWRYRWDMPRPPKIMV